MIRVLHLVGTMNCGGTQNMLMNIYRKIDRTKVQFDFLINVKEKCFFSDEIEKLGGRIFYIPKWKPSNTFTYIKLLDKFLEEHPECQILHTHIASSAMFNIKSAKKHNMYTIAHSHNMKGEGFSLESMFVKMGSFPVRFMADHFFSCSKESGKVRYGRKVINSDKFDILKNAIDIKKYGKNEETYTALTEKYQLENKFVVGHVGRFYAVKNHMFLLDVFNEIVKKKENSVLMLVGGGGEMQKPLEEKIKELGLWEKVIFTGVTSDVNSFLQTMDCFVFPSFNEGLGIVVIEAECLGIPCFINKTLSEELFINENVFGLSLDESPDRWADYILQNSDKGIPEKTSQDNIIKAGYDINETTKKIEEFYLSVCR